MNCIECEKIKNKRHLVYEDELVAALLDEKPAAAGQISLYPKAHFAIFEMVPDEIVSHMFVIANRLAMACFDTLEAEGTNILIKNGVPGGQKTNHAQLLVIPRK